jgi:hypothetical protein
LLLGGAAGCADDSTAGGETGSQEAPEVDVEGAEQPDTDIPTGDAEDEARPQITGLVGPATVRPGQVMSIRVYTDFENPEAIENLAVVVEGQSGWWRVPATVEPAAPGDPGEWLVYLHLSAVVTDTSDDTLTLNIALMLANDVAGGYKTHVTQVDGEPVSCPADAACGDVECGPDPLCATECGMCDEGFACNAFATCIPTASGDGDGDSGGDGDSAGDGDGDSGGDGDSTTGDGDSGGDGDTSGDGDGDSGGDGDSAGDGDGTGGDGDGGTTTGGDGDGDGVCGDGVLEAGEDCDIGDLGGMTCEDFGLLSGNLLCGPGCSFDLSQCETCGNGAVDGDEDCDQSDLNGASCVSLGLVSGDLACDSSCKFDMSGCETCGNGVGEAGEACDGDDFGSQTCEDFGYVSGSLTCTAGCSVDLSACLGCGNDVADGSEECDGSDLKNQSCTDFSFDGGTLGCTESCTIDTTNCNGCGNGVIEGGGGEVCDTDQIPSDCGAQGFEGGVLGCDNTCQYDTSTCFNYAELNLLLNGGGSVDVAPLDETCWGNCTQDVAENTQLTLTATAGPGQVFTGWTGAPSCTTDPTCVVDVTGDMVVTAQFDASGANYAFVTNEAWTGNLGGRDGADALCQAAAQNAGLPGTYWALLADTSKTGEENAATRFLDAGVGGWIRTDGRLFAVSADDLFNNDHQYYPLDKDEFGGARARVGTWSGTVTNYAPGNTCTNWTTTGGHGAGGTSGYGGQRYSYDNATINCWGARALTCLGVDSTVALAPPPTPTERRIFVTGGTYAPSASGIGAFDLACQNEASAAGLTGNGEVFKAYMANPDGEAPDRFKAPEDPTIPGPVFTRIDGVRVASNMEDFVSGIHLALINIEASGAVEGSASWTWTGVNANGTDNDSRDCGGWVNTGLTGVYGSLEEKARNFAHNTTSCAAAYRLICAED